MKQIFHPPEFFWNADIFYSNSLEKRLLFGYIYKIYMKKMNHR